MKTRLDFITNSSSASFIIQLKDLTALQLAIIQDPIRFAQQVKALMAGKDDNDYNRWYEYCDDGCAWDVDIDEEKGIVTLDTVMDNLDMAGLLQYIGVDLEKIKMDRD